MIARAAFALGAVFCATTLATPAAAQLVVSTAVPSPYATTINPGDTTAVRISITNGNTGSAITNTQFNLNLRAQANSELSVVDAGGGSGVQAYTCTNGDGTPATTQGTVTAVAGGTTISLSGGRIPPRVLSGTAGQCDITILMTSTRELGNDFIIQVGDVTGIDGGTPAPSNPQAAPQTITVAHFDAPTISKTFGNPSITLGNSTTVQLKIKNNSGIAPLLLNGSSDSPNYGVRDNLAAAGLVVGSGTPTLVGSCTGVTTPDTAGSTKFDVVGGSIAAGQTCTITFPVTTPSSGATIGTMTNTIDKQADFHSPRGVDADGNATAQLTINSSIAVKTAFGVDGSPIPNNGQSTVTYVIENFGGATLNQTGSFHGIPGRFDQSEIVAAGTSTEGIILLGAPTVTNCGSPSITLDADNKGFVMSGAQFPVGNEASHNACTLVFDYKGVLVAGNPDPSQVFTNFVKDGDVKTVEGPQNVLSTSSVTIVNSLVGDKYMVGPNGDVGQNGTALSISGGQIIKYKLIVANYSPAGKLVITDPLPAGMTAIPNSLEQLAGGAPECASNIVMNTTDATTPVFVYSSFPAATASDAQRCEFTFSVQVPASLPDNADLTNTIDNCHFRYGAAADSAGVGRAAGTPSSAGTCALRGTGAPGIFVAPLTIQQQFASSPVSAGSPVALTYTLNNLSGYQVNNVQFDDTLPAGMSFVSATGTQCGGSITSSIVSGQTVIHFTGGHLVERDGGGLGPLAGPNQCTVVVNVTGTPGNYNNDIPGLTLQGIQAQGTGFSVQSSQSPSNASITFVGALSTSKSFSPATVANGGLSRVTITLQNGSTTAYNNVKVIDPLTSTNLVLPATVGGVDAQTTCGGSPVITATPGSATATLEGVTLPSGQQCTFSFNVLTSGNPMAGWTNTIPAGNVTADGGIFNVTPVTATLNNGAASNVTIGITTNPSALAAPGQKSTLIVTLTNPGSTTLTNLNLTDYLTANGMAGGADQGFVIYSTPNAQTTCTGGTVSVLDSTSFRLTGATLAGGNTSCTFQVDVTLLQLGTKTNFIPASQVHNDQNITNASGVNGNLGLSGTIGVVKQFAPVVVKPNVPSRLTITLYNLVTEGVNNLTFTDTLPSSPSGLTIASPANASTTCASASITGATPGGNTIGITGGHLDASSGTAQTCTISVDVVSAVVNAYTNTIPIAQVQGVTANSSTPVQNVVAATATLQVRTPVAIAKSFSPTSVTPGQESTATITLTNPNNVALTNAFLSDTLPSGLFVSNSVAPSTTCGSGVVQANPSGTAIQMTNGTLPSGPASCTITFKVVSNIAATYTNVIPANALTTLMGVTNEAPAQASLVVHEPPSVSKSFFPPSIPANQTSTLTITLHNTTAGVATLTAPLVDTLPTTPGSPGPITVNGAASTTCTGGSLTAAMNSGTVTLGTGAQIPANGTCTITVPVTGATTGTHVNTIPSNALQTDIGNNVQPATANLEISTLGFIAGRVFKDIGTSDGVYQAGTDTPILGVTVNLYAGATASGSPTATASTNASGEYAFTGLAAGTYSLGEPTQPAGTLNGVTLAGTISGTGTAGTASNQATTPSVIQNIVLGGSNPVASSVDNNFAEVVGSSLSGFVYNDANNDGNKDGGETGVVGVTINLYSGAAATGSPIQNATTDGNGAYSFAGLTPGIYSIGEPTQPSGTADGKTTAGSAGGTATAQGTTPSSITNISLGSNVTSTNNNFGEVTTSTISGRIFADANDNGAFDAGTDAGINNVTVNLYSGATATGSPVATTTTNTNGDYSFSGLAAGTYSIGEPTQPPGTADGKTTAGTLGGTATPQGTTPSAVSSIVVPVGGASTGNLFGEVPITGTISGRVYADANNNGTPEAGETGYAGVAVQLFNGATVSGPAAQTVNTDATGYYTFTGLTLGTYSVFEPGQPAGSTNGITTAGAVGGGAANNPSASTSAITGIVLNAGAPVSTGNNFGEIPPPTTTATTVGGKVYRDVNNNGVVDSDEVGIPAVTVTLTGKDKDDNPVNLTTQTDASGAYSFTVPPSDSAGYTITETQPSAPDGKTTAPTGSPGSAKPVSAGGADKIVGVVVATTSLTDFNFGERTGSTIGGRVYKDLNDNGIIDAGEAGVAGVTVRLTGTDSGGAAVNLTTTTDANGAYSFAVASSNAAGYTITEVQPDLGDGKTTAPGVGQATASKPVPTGGADTIAGVVLTTNPLTGFNFGERDLPKVAGYAFADANNNGVKDAGEQPIAGVTVTLTGVSAAGAPVSLTTTTAADGTFVFVDVPLSNAAGYTITETQPTGFTDGKTVVTPGQPGTPNSAKAVNVGDQDRVVGVVVPANTNRGDYIFAEVPVLGLKPPIVNGYVYLDRDHSRVRPTDGTIEGLSGWTVVLRQNGQVICTTTTNEKGFYQFDNLHCPGYEASGLPTGSGFSITFSRDGSNLPAVPTSGGGRGQVPPSGGQILNITLSPADQVVEQNLPLDPAGTIYNSVTRATVAGAVVTIAGPAGFDPVAHLVGGTAAQTQTTGADGLYQFLLQNDFPTGVYTLTVTAPANFQPAPSTSIPPCPGVLAVTLAPNPALVQAYDNPPPSSAPNTCVGLQAGGANSTQYYLQFNITNGGSADILNNHIPLDPQMTGALFITKTSPMVNVARGDLVPYTITATNTEAKPSGTVTIRDQLPPGFKYRDGTATRNGVKVAPTIDNGFVTWPPETFAAKEKKTYTLMLTVGAGVSDGDYVNRAWGAAPGGGPSTNIASATVRIVPDPTFDCPDIIGKVFDDKNANGYQDDGEPGIPGVRVATANGLLITSDAEGRFHIPCPTTPDMDRGSNFVLKLDPRTLPSGFRLTTENPASIRVTRGKMVKLNFGATIHRVVRIELSDGAFEPGATTLKAEFRASLDALPAALAERPSVVRVAYRTGSDPADLTKKRIEAVRALIRAGWTAAKGRYPLDVEVEGGQP